MPRIHKRFVDSMAPVDRRTFKWDDRLPGFGIVAQPSGARSFVFQYRTTQGRSRRITIGKVGTITPDQARKIAEGHAATVKDGGDPMNDKRDAKSALTVDDVLNEYLISGKFAEKAESTQSIDRGRIDRHLRPILGMKYADKLSVEDVRRALASIRDGRTATVQKTKARGKAVVTGGAGTAREAIALLRSILNWAAEEKLIKANPAAAIKLGGSGTREIFLDEPEHYTRLFSALSALEDEKAIRPEAADAIRVIALTGARKSEITRCRWQYVNHKSGTLTLPPAAHKTGRATGKARVITLPAVAQEIIAKQPVGAPDDFVFRPAKGNGGELDIKRAWRLVRTKAELPDGIGLHGLRHSVASLMALNGAGAAEIMAALGHRQLTTTQRYVHFAQNARAALAEKAALPAMAGMAAASGDRAAGMKMANGKQKR